MASIRGILAFVTIEPEVVLIYKFQAAYKFGIFKVTVACEL